MMPLSILPVAICNDVKGTEKVNISGTNIELDKNQKLFDQFAGT